MSLIKTNLVVIASQLPADFSGTPQEFFAAIIKRMSIQSPAGVSFFQTGDIAPATDMGPWLKNGTKWYVWSTSEGEYVPLDITDSTEKVFTISDVEPDEPGDDDARIWLRTFQARVIAWYFWTGTEWRPGGNVPPSGPTESRPVTAKDLEEFFDTDINVMLHWERGAWRTVSGSPGDIKFVTHSTLVEALEINPGWDYVGNIHQSWIGRTLAVAAKDPGGSPVNSYATDSGITARAALDVAGSETHVLNSTEIEQHTHLLGALTALNSDNNARFYRVDDGENFSAPAPRPPNYAQVNGDNANDGTQTGELPTPSAGTMMITSKQLSLSDAEDYTEAADGHNTIQPTLYVWALTKL